MEGPVCGTRKRARYVLDVRSSPSSTASIFWNLPLLELEQTGRVLRILEDGLETCLEP